MRSWPSAPRPCRNTTRARGWRPSAGSCRGPSRSINMSATAGPSLRCCGFPGPPAGAGPQRHARMAVEVPEEAGRRAAVRPPGLAQGGHAPDIGPPLQLLQMLRGDAERKVAGRQHVGPPQREEQIDLGGPAADALDPGRSEEHTSELQSLMRISYAVF